MLWLCCVCRCVDYVHVTDIIENDEDDIENGGFGFTEDCGNATQMNRDRLTLGIIQLFA